MKMDKRVQEIAESIELIEALAPDVAWSFSTITSKHHALTPIGQGVSVTINAPGTEKHPEPITIFEKHLSFREATDRAIARYRRKAAGEDWA